MRRVDLSFSAVIVSCFLFVSGCVVFDGVHPGKGTDSVDSSLQNDSGVCQELQQLPCAERQMVREIRDYLKYIKDLSEKNLEKELEKVAAYNLDDIDYRQQLHVILLSFSAAVSPSDNSLLKQMLDSIKIDSQNEEHELLEVLFEFAQRHTVRRMQNDLLSKELGESLKKIIILEEVVMAERKKSENLQKQLQGLRDIEKIILKREKSDLPDR